MMRLQDKTAIVTGGARGIGKAICGALAGEGARLAVVDVAGDAADETAAAFRAEGYDAQAFAADVSTPADADAMVKQVLAAYDRIDILVNNAGVTRDGLLVRVEDKDWDSVMAADLKGAFNRPKAVAPTISPSMDIQVSSNFDVVGVTGNAGQANYSASKAGILGLTKSTAKEFASRHIQVNAVAPGYIATEMTEQVSEDARQAFLELIPLARPGTPEDVAAAVCFLASADADYITGQTLHVDGGLVM
mgnify:CR=1 FL=1